MKCCWGSLISLSRFKDKEAASSPGAGLLHALRRKKDQFCDLPTAVQGSQNGYCTHTHTTHTHKTHTHMYMYIYIYIHIYTYIYTYIYTNICIYMYIYVHTCIHTCMQTYIHTRMIWVCKCRCINVNLYISVNV